MKMNPIDIYVHVKFYAKRYDYSKPSFEQFIQHLAGFESKIPSLDELEEMFDRYPPSETSVVQALYDLGISPNTIAKTLGITKQAVSYRRKRPYKPYNNPAYNALFK